MIKKHILFSAILSALLITNAHAQSSQNYVERHKKQLENVQYHVVDSPFERKLIRTFASLYRGLYETQKCADIANITPTCMCSAKEEAFAMLATFDKIRAQYPEWIGSTLVIINPETHETTNFDMPNSTYASRLNQIVTNCPEDEEGEDTQ